MCLLALDVFLHFFGNHTTLPGPPWDTQALPCTIEGCYSHGFRCRWCPLECSNMAALSPTCREHCHTHPITPPGSSPLMSHAAWCRAGMPFGQDFDVIPQIQLHGHWGSMTRWKNCSCCTLSLWPWLDHTAQVISITHLINPRTVLRLAQLPGFCNYLCSIGGRVLKCFFVKCKEIKIDKNFWYSFDISSLYLQRTSKIEGT